jgi:hypothetical protein
MKPLRVNRKVQDILTDPLIETMMSADGVDVPKLATMLDEIAGMLDGRSRRIFEPAPSLCAARL